MESNSVSNPSSRRSRLRRASSVLLRKITIVENWTEARIITTTARNVINTYDMLILLRIGSDAMARRNRLRRLRAVMAGLASGCHRSPPLDRVRRGPGRVPSEEPLELRARPFADAYDGIVERQLCSQARGR